MSGRFTSTASTVLLGLAEAAPLPMWAVSRRRGDEWVLLAAQDREYGLQVGDALAWEATLCAQALAGRAPETVGDIAEVPAFAEAARGLGMDIGAYVTVPLRAADGQLLGTLCGADPERRPGPLHRELAHARRAAVVLSVLLEQQLLLDAGRRRGAGDSVDGLTGLGDRAHWSGLLEVAEASCAALGSRAHLLAVDLLGLAVRAAEVGPAAADELVRTAADVVRRQARDAGVARTGTDRFAVLLVDLDERQVQQAADGLRRALAAQGVHARVRSAARTGERTARQAWDELEAHGEGAPDLVSTSPEEEFVPGHDLDALLHEARTALELPVAFLTQFVGGDLVVQAVDSEGPVDLHPGDRQPSEGTYCRALVDRRLPQVLPDTCADLVAVTPAATSALRIGSFVGVPVVLPDGAVYGTLCAYAEQPGLVADRDSAVLHLVARTMGQHLGPQLQRWQREQSVRRRVREVLSGGLLTTVYQPVVDAGTGRAVAVEALSRFPERYGRRPDQWFLDALEVGQATALELAALTSAVRGLAGLPSHVDLAVNVSPAVAVTPEFAAWLETAPLHRLVLELTEHAPVQDAEGLCRALAPARARGLRVAVDDAGAGYASLRLVLQLEPDFIKLDLSLVRDVDTDHSRRSLCAAVVTFAHETGALVVAEGVETVAELQALRELGVDELQGFLLQRPTEAPGLALDGYVGFARPAPLPGWPLVPRREPLAVRRALA